MRVEDTDDLGDLYRQYGKNRYNRGEGRTGSSALLVLLKVDDAPLTSSIMLIRSLPISSRRSDSFSANLYLITVSKLLLD